ncbi:class I SAM-dependent methyltransferase [Thioalkalivibrio sulfidiphilus]|uniref:class I SAM-dependent methyltransferase n=1 Tax=Thioalkalivibrio sulfidiphilus TaxID=1033854 RepID=UPI003B2ECC7E
MMYKKRIMGNEKYMKEAVKLEGEGAIHEWPAEGLERVDSCPVCRCDQRNQLYTGLTDRVFRCAPGRWSLYQCEGCQSAYLDPRPTPDAIGLAYSTYYTHEVNSREEAEHLSWPRRIRRILANGYRNHRFGTNIQPASWFGMFAAWLLPSMRETLHGEFRHMPRADRGPRLLDVGCGNGSFLRVARAAGWHVVGVDFDPNAVKTARSQGLDVREGGLRFLILTRNLSTVSH